MSINDKQICMFGEAPGSIVDGPGIRYGVFCQGCSHNCPGCHNPKSHDYNSGTLRDVDTIVQHIQHAPSTHGVTLSGGEPFDQAPAMAYLAAQLKQLGYNIWIYSGYKFEYLFELSLTDEAYQILADTTSAEKYKSHQNKNSIPKVALYPQAAGKLLANVDVLVDGLFVESKKSYDALYRGSTNQRLVDVPKSLRAGKYVAWKQDFELPKIPSSW